MIQPHNVNSSQGKMKNTLMMRNQSSLSFNYLSINRKNGRSSNVGPLMCVANPDDGENDEEEEEKKTEGDEQFDIIQNEENPKII